jgi:hypothetical protein
MICRHCGATLPDSSNFCIYCGVPQEGNFVPPPPFQPTVYRPQLSIAQLLGDTFTLYARHFIIMCLIGLFIVGVQTFFGVCSAATDKNNVPFILLFALLAWIASCYVRLGAARHCLYTARGGADFQPGLMFPSFVMFMKMVALDLIIVCITLPFALLGIPVGVMLAVAVTPFMNVAPAPIGMVQGVLIGVIGGTIAACMFMLYPAARLWLTPFFFVDRKMGVIDSVFTAWRVSSGNFWKLCAGIVIFLGCIFCWTIPCTLVLQFVFELKPDTVSGTLILNVGLIPLAAIIWLGGSLAYLQMTGEPNRLDREKSDQETMLPLAF